MEQADVGAVRRFNRIVTERVGALNDHYLSRARPLGASRVLWEIGAGVDEVRALRSRLGLDSGYLSRLLRSLETEGLISVQPAEHDRRLRVATLTPEGESERDLLDQQSDSLANAMLAALDDSQRRRLIEAMATVERLLTAGLVQVEVAHPASNEAQHCIRHYFAELDQRFDSGFDPELSISAEIEELTEPAGLLLVARLRDEVVGCGALKLHPGGPGEPAEIKRMWVSPAARGLGLGRRLLLELERQASERGVSVVRLETNATLSEAINLYRSAGYEEVPAFNEEPFAHHWFEKEI